MNSKFENDILIKNTFKELLRYQRYSERANLIGLIQLDNCLDRSALMDFMSRKYNSGNLFYSYKSYHHYKKIFNLYLDLLGEDNIYPSKEVFISELFINGQYDFLNFTKYDSRYNSYEKTKDGILTISYFELQDFFSPTEYCNNKIKHTRIKKGNVIRFFSKELTQSEHFDDSSCYLTLTTDGISNDEFNAVFKASNFRLETSDVDEPVEFIVHKFIKKMISLGEKYTIDNPTNGSHKVRILDYRSNTKKSIGFFDKNNIEIEDEIIFDLRNISVNDIVSRYKVINIIREQDSFVKIILENL